MKKWDKFRVEKFIFHSQFKIVAARATYFDSCEIILVNRLLLLTSSAFFFSPISKSIETAERAREWRAKESQIRRSRGATWDHSRSIHRFQSTMWRRLLSSSLKSLKSLPSSSTPASAPLGCISQAARLGAASHLSPSSTVSLFARHYASDSGRSCRFLRILCSLHIYVEWIARLIINRLLSYSRIDL